MNFTLTEYMTPIRIERFLSRVDRSDPNGCHEWTAYRDDKGYGKLSGSINGQTFSLRAHRVAYFLEHGEDPGFLLVRHSCDNAPCCRGSHLLLGTDQDNSDDMHERHRAHPLKQRFSEEKVQEIRRLVASGKRPSAVAAEMNCGHNTVKRYASGLYSPRTHSKETIQEARRLVSLGIPVSAIAQELGCCENSVRRWVNSGATF